MNNKNQKQRKIPIIYSFMIWSIILLGNPFSVATAQDEFCAPSSVNPTIDGDIDSDFGWNNAMEIGLSDDMGASKAAAMLAGRNASNVYLGFKVDVPPPGTDNTLVLAIATDATAGNDWRIHVKPFDVSTSVNNVAPHIVTYWRDSGTWNNAGAVANVAGAGTWLKDNMRLSSDGIHWTLEIEIPRAANAGAANDVNGIFFDPSPGNFDFYANILTAPIGTIGVTQDPWPPGNIMVAGASTLITRNTPAKSDWGTLTFNTGAGCGGGVTLAWNDIGVDDPTSSGTIINEIRRISDAIVTEANLAACQALPDNVQWPGTQGPTNTFVIRPGNTMASNAQVTSRVTIANWGIPSNTSWGPLGEPVPDVGNTGVTANPPLEITLPPGPASSANQLTVDWNMSYKQSCLYKFQDHQCIRVELESSNPGTRIIDRVVQRNMDFVSASTFTRDAEISAVGYGAPPAGLTEHGFMLVVDTLRYTYTLDQPYYYGSRYGVSAPPEFNQIPMAWYPDGLEEALVWTTRGYRRTGNTLTIGSNDYEYVEPVGAFGVLAGHDGPVRGWEQELLGGSDLQKINGNDNVYMLEIPEDQVATVTTFIKSLPPSVFAIFLHGGINSPQGDFDTVFDPGLSLNVGLEYALNSQFSGVLTAGYHQFESTSSLLDDVNVFQLSANARYYPVQSTLRPFANGGIGVYAFDPGDTSFGFNVGAGVQYRLTSSFSLEGAFNYHRPDDGNTSGAFATIQGGIHIRF